MATIATRPLTREAFAPFGQVLDWSGAHVPINAGRAERYHDLARVELAGAGARAAVSLVRAQPVCLPYGLTMVERHPLGSQAFHPLSQRPFLVVVAPDHNGRPGTPLAFITAPGQGINYAINTWHGVLTPLEEPADFVIVDREGEGTNLEVHAFAEPYTVERG